MSHLGLRYTRCYALLLYAVNRSPVNRNELPYDAFVPDPSWLIPYEEEGDYYDPNDFNRVIYHCSDVDAEERISVLLSDADLLLERCNGSFEEVAEYQLFARCISEQTTAEDGKRRLRKKADGGMDSGILQNPSDPDATFREKSGKKHRGYAGNIEESVGKNGSIVTDYQFDANNKSDS